MNWELRNRKRSAAATVFAAALVLVGGSTGGCGKRAKTDDSETKQQKVEEADKKQKAEEAEAERIRQEVIDSTGGAVAAVLGHPPGAAPAAPNTANPGPDKTSAASSAQLAAPQLASLDQVTELIRTAGYSPRKCWEKYPCFDALNSEQAAEVGIDRPLPAMYFLPSGKNMVIFLFPLRALSMEEAGGPMHPQGTGYSFPLLDQLNSSSYSRLSKFTAGDLRLLSTSRVDTVQPTLPLEVGMSAESNPSKVMNAISAAATTLQQTKNLWK